MREGGRDIGTFYIKYKCNKSVTLKWNAARDDLYSSLKIDVDSANLLGKAVLLHAFMHVLHLVMDCVMAQSLWSEVQRDLWAFNICSIAAHTVVPSCGCSFVWDAAVVVFRCASLGLVCNNVTRLLLDRCAPLSLWHTYTHIQMCTEREREKSPFPPPSWISFHTLLMGPELSCDSLGWALLDSWGWMRGVVTPAMNCFLFLLKRSSEACGDHRRGWRPAGAHPVWADAATVKNIHQPSSSWNRREGR